MHHIVATNRKLHGVMRETIRRALSLVAEGPSSGYELMKKAESRAGGVYRASAGTVYPTLQQLEDEGLIASESQEGKRVYRLTTLDAERWSG